MAGGMQPNDLMVGWTTTETREEAEHLGKGLVETGLAACTQVSGPITSFYRWDRKLETAQEFRLTVKFPAVRADQVSDWIQAHHGYETPQWVAVRADAALKNYLKWVVDDPS